MCTMPGSPCQALQQCALHGHRGLYSLRVTTRSNVYTGCTSVHEHCIAKPRCAASIIKKCASAYSTSCHWQTSTMPPTCRVCLQANMALAINDIARLKQTMQPIKLLDHLEHQQYVDKDYALSSLYIHTLCFVNVLMGVLHRMKNNHWSCAPEHACLSILRRSSASPWQEQGF